MSTTPETFYITTPIYYVNDRPHIGHVYTTTIADILARYHRLRGEDVFFLTGTDEHATKVVDAAKERNVTPQEWADTCAAAFRETFEKINITNDDFIRTSEARHTEKVQEYVAALLESGDVYLGEYEGWYDPGEEEYVPENRAQEFDFKSPISGRDLVKKTEQNYFFKLSAYREQVIDKIESGEFDVKPDARKNEIINRLKEAQDVPISRTGIGATSDGGWGIAVPGNPEHTIYVWIDALFNYLTTVDTDERRHYWEAGATHLIAKDILWFHAAIWPAVLLALQKCDGYDWVRLPKQVYAHSFWISEGQKMSKSLGNFIDLEKIDDYIDRFSLDALRYFLAKNGPMGTTDSDFAESAFIETYNTDLANTFGNSFSRVSNMAAKYFDGALVAADTDTDIAASAKQASTDSTTAINQLDLEKTCNSAKSVVEAVDGYIEATQPFKLAKEEEKLPEVQSILSNCAEGLRVASLLYASVIPDAANKVWDRLALDYNTQDQLDTWTQWGQLQPGTKIEKGDPLFMRYTPPKD